MEYTIKLRRLLYEDVYLVYYDRISLGDITIKNTRSLAFGYPTVFLKIVLDKKCKELEYIVLQERIYTKKDIGKELSNIFFNWFFKEDNHGNK
ncbi:hypothetical protein [Cetobacterium sp.]|uniref:hypothetical protein n=1 Tax=Cetobacterium sp. TaxID=2071632 RepID=UPI003F37AB12